MSSNLNKSSPLDKLADKNNAIAQVQGAVSRVTQVENLGEFNIKCMSCDKTLLVLLKVSDSPTEMGLDKNRNPILVQKQKFQSNCPFCDSKSWIVSVEGQAKIGEAENCMITEYNFGDPNDPEGMFNKITLEKYG